MNRLLRQLFFGFILCAWNFSVQKNKKPIEAFLIIFPEIYCKAAESLQLLQPNK